MIALFSTENAYREIFESKSVDILLVIMILEIFNRVQNSIRTLNLFLILESFNYGNVVLDEEIESKLSTRPPLRDEANLTSEKLCDLLAHCQSETNALSVTLLLVSESAEHLE